MFASKSAFNSVISEFLWNAINPRSNVSDGKPSESGSGNTVSKSIIVPVGVEEMPTKRHRHAWRLCCYQFFSSSSSYTVGTFWLVNALPFSTLLKPSSIELVCSMQSSTLYSSNLSIRLSNKPISWQIRLFLYRCSIIEQYKILIQ